MKFTLKAFGMGISLAAMLSVGMAEASQRVPVRAPSGNLDQGATPPPGYEGLKSTAIVQGSKNIVNHYQNAKSSLEALNKMCGKGGLFPSMANCGASIGIAEFSVIICNRTPGFDQTPCGKKAMGLLWPQTLRQNPNTPLATLMNKKIEIPLKEQLVGKDEFRTVIDTAKQNLGQLHDKTLMQEMESSINNPQGYKLTNMQFILCTYDQQNGQFSPRKNLSDNMGLLAKKACTLATQNLPKMLVEAPKQLAPTRPQISAPRKIVEDGPMIQPPMTGGLRDLPSRGGMESEGYTPPRRRIAVGAQSQPSPAGAALRQSLMLCPMVTEEQNLSVLNELLESADAVENAPREITLPKAVLKRMSQSPNANVQTLLSQAQKMCQGLSDLREALGE